VLLAGQFGHYIYNNTANAWLNMSASASGRNVTADVVGLEESTANEPAASSRFLEKGDFVRLQEASIGYRLPFMGRKIKEVNVSITGQNLFIMTDYSGLDPEVNTSASTAAQAGYGIDYGSYPRPRTFSVRVGVSF
jgi:hypothetical protein